MPFRALPRVTARPEGASLAAARATPAPFSRSCPGRPLWLRASPPTTCSTPGKSRGQRGSRPTPSGCSRGSERRSPQGAEREPPAGWSPALPPSGLTLHRLLHVAAAPLPCGGARSTASSSSSPSHAAQAPPPLLLLPLKARTQARQPHPRGTGRMRLRGPRAGQPERGGVRGRGDGR